MKKMLEKNLTQLENNEKNKMSKKDIFLNQLSKTKKQNQKK
jgi:hypothetical protein